METFSINMFNEIKALVQKDYFLDLRSKTALAGLLLYILSTMFTCYLSFHKIVDVPTWNALFWIIILFTAILINPSYAVEEAPEIPAGFGPVIVSGLMLSITAIKSFMEKNSK